jgi:hypothetical protein
MTEPLLENMEPLNSKAKEFLKQVKEIPDETGLYCLQLAIWGVEKGGLEVDSRVSENLPTLMQEPPGVMMKRLEMFDPKTPDEYLDLLNGHKTPEDLAWSVLDRVRDILDPILGLTREPTRD